VAKTLRKLQNSIIGTIELKIINCLLKHDNFCTLQQILDEVYKENPPSNRTAYKKYHRAAENLHRKQFLDKKIEKVGKQDVVSYKANREAINLVFLLHSKNYIKDNKNLNKIDKQLGLGLLRVFDIF